MKIFSIESFYKFFRGLIHMRVRPDTVLKTDFEDLFLKVQKCIVCIFPRRNLYTNVLT